MACAGYLWVRHARSGREALDLVPAFDAERTQGLARSLAESAESAVLHPELVMLGAW